MLDLANISVAYGRREVVRNVTMTVAEGEVVALIGSNGAGKSTTLKAISGLLPLRSGSIHFNGQCISNRPPHEIVAQGLAHVPEGRKLFPDMTVREHLELGAIRKKGREGVQADQEAWVLGLFPLLKERWNQTAGTMSGGQQQMLAIARGLMSNPVCVMFDEPSLGLAPVIVDQLMDVIQCLQAAGIATLLVEQRVDLALSIASRVYVIENGHLSLSGEADDLRNDPRIEAAYLGT